MSRYMSSTSLRPRRFLVSKKRARERERRAPRGRGALDPFPLLLPSSSSSSSSMIHQVASAASSIFLFLPSSCPPACLSPFCLPNHQRHFRLSLTPCLCLLFLCRRLFLFSFPLSHLHRSRCHTHAHARARAHTHTHTLSLSLSLSLFPSTSSPSSPSLSPPLALQAHTCETSLVDRSNWPQESPCKCVYVSHGCAGV